MTKSISNVKYSLVIFSFLFSVKIFAGNLPDELLRMPIALMSGEQTSLAEYNGEKPVYLKFWATWCQPCMKEMPHFEHVQKEYADSLAVIGINLGMNDDRNSVEKVIEQFDLSMPMAIDESGDLVQAFRMIGTPYHLLFDRNMNLVHVGHKANESLDNKIALVSQTKTMDLLDASLLDEAAADTLIEMDDNKTNALFFTAAWCDWYLKDTRPEMSKNCIAAQEQMNNFYSQYPDIKWNGILSRLWTGDKDLADYKKKYAIEHPLQVDKNNRLFHRYQVNDMPTLILVRDNKVIAKTTDFMDEEALRKLLDH